MQDYILTDMSIVSDEFSFSDEDDSAKFSFSIVNEVYNQLYKIATSNIWATIADN